MPMTHQSTRQRNSQQKVSQGILFFTSFFQVLKKLNLYGHIIPSKDHKTATLREDTNYPFEIQ